MGSDQNKELPLHLGSVNAISSALSDIQNQHSVGRNNMLLMGSFAVLTFLVMFLVDPTKLKDLVDNVGKSSKNHLSWANLGMDAFVQRKANINGDDDATLEDRISRQSVLLDIIQENKDKRPTSIRGGKPTRKQGASSSGGTKATPWKGKTWNWQISIYKCTITNYIDTDEINYGFVSKKLEFAKMRKERRKEGR